MPVLDRFPRLTLVLAHLCQPFYDDLLALGERYPRLCTDLSFVLGARLLPADRLVPTVRAFGVDRVLFSADELAVIGAGNAERIFGWGAS